MHQASVGFHCPACSKAGRQDVRTGASAFGTRVAPYLTYVLIGLNALVFLIGVVVDGSGALLGDMGTMHIDFGLVAKGFVEDGGSYRAVGVGEGEWYRMVTSGFLHYGMFHLAVNMFALFSLGRVLEVGIGRLRTGLIYGASMVAGSTGALMVSPDSLTAGASGAIFGLMGGLLVIMRAQGVAFRDSPLLPTLVLNLGLTFFFSRYISVGGHVGGFLGGAAAAWILVEVSRRRGLPTWAPTAAVVAFALACAGIGIVVANSYDPFAG